MKMLRNAKRFIYVTVELNKKDGMAIGLSSFYFEAIRILPVIPNCVDNNFFSVISK